MAKDKPIYIQIHNQIRKMIEKEQWQVGERIPSERDLARLFEVSRMTLRQAVQTLVDEGILERQIGSGTYVASQKVQEEMTGVESFTKTILSQGRIPTSKTISYHVKPASISESEQLKLKDETLVLRMERVRYADQLPICFEVATIPYHFIESLEKQEITASLYKTLEEKQQLVMARAEQTVSAMMASERTAEYLGIKRGDPILRLKQITYSTADEPFEYVRTQYVGERFQFHLDKKAQP
ncbi:MAG: GntR family transcriptional regulator [Pisciglobus halotolerans]|nr:GntR family transcriptional regulator [Pisciglobus halotolerans]